MLSHESCVEMLKKDFEKHVINYNIHQNDVNVIFRDWVFEKLADIIRLDDGRTKEFN